jgi:hypothetical protein
VLNILLSLLTFFLITFHNGGLLFADRGLVSGYSEYSAENIRGFAGHLAEKKEYYRAYLEIDRLESYYPGYLSPMKLHVTRNYLLFMGERYKNVISYNYPGSDKNIAGALSLFRFDSYMKLSDYGGAGKILDSSAKESHFPEMFLKRRFYYSAMTGRLDLPENSVTPGEVPDFSAYTGLKEYSQRIHDSMKSPAAAVMWGIIPGMGYVYSGKKSTGMVATIVIALNAAISYYAFTSGSESIGVFVGIIGTFFYTGSILGGYMAANKYNSGMTDLLHRRLSRDLQLDRDLEEIYSSQGIGKDGKKE